MNSNSSLADSITRLRNSESWVNLVSPTITGDTFPVVADHAVFIAESVHTTRIRLFYGSTVRAIIRQ
ncbi:MAG: hypothetical protein GF363_00080 [Chitinivibrionales bacterium]|nr:hypothetical protein [Chitinivibrionales bacterium]